MTTNFTIKGISIIELENFITQNGFSKYRAHQIYNWLYKKGAMDVQSMHNISNDLQSFLINNAIINTLTLSKKVQCDNTIKFLFKTKTNQYIESVSMIEGDKHTVCLSSQVGCSVDCDFCATGKMGFISNLNTGEIIDQIQLVNKKFDGIIINPAALTHTSVAILDALKSVNKPKIEIHLSNIYTREEYRRKSLTSEGVDGLICGFGGNSYILAIDAINNLIYN